MIEALGVGPVDLFGSSGGAVNALALVAAHPDDVRRVVAHEPPTAALLPDRDAVLAVCRDMRATYEPTAADPPWRSSSRSSCTTAGARRLPGPAGAGPGDVRDVERGRRRPHRPADAQHAGLQHLRARRRARCGPRDRLVVAVGVESGQELAARGGAVRGRGGRACRSPSTPATTVASSAGSTASRATPTLSQPRCTPPSTEGGVRLVVPGTFTAACRRRPAHPTEGTDP